MHMGGDVGRVLSTYNGPLSTSMIDEKRVAVLVQAAYLSLGASEQRI